MESGQSKLYNRKCFGYQQDLDGNLIINEEEAETVLKVFNMYLNGFSVIATIRELEKQGVKSPTGKDCWSKRAIETNDGIQKTEKTPILSSANLL